MKPIHHIGFILIILWFAFGGFLALWLLYERRVVGGWAIFFAIDNAVCFGLGTLVLVDYIARLKELKRK